MPLHGRRRASRRIRMSRRCSAALVTAAGFVLVATSASAAVPGAHAAPSRTYRPAAGHLSSWSSALEPLRAFTTAARAVNFGGTTTAQVWPLVIVLKADGKSIARITNEGTAKCASGKRYLLNDDLRGAVPIRATGSFAAQHIDSEVLGDGFTGHVLETITGKVRGKKITGSLKVHVDVTSSAGDTVQDTCDLATTFSLVSAARREYAGATSQGEPVLVELTRDLRKVDHFHIGWRGPCTPSDTAQAGEFLSSFPVTAGRFGDSWTDRYTEPDGGYEVQDFTVSGSIKGTTAKGSFRTKVTFFDASGAAAGSCESGAVSWKAASG